MTLSSSAKTDDDDRGGGRSSSSSSSLFATALQMPPHKKSSSSSRSRSSSSLSKKEKQSTTTTTRHEEGRPPTYYSQGLDTYQVPMSLHKINRSRLTKAMLNKILQQQQQTVNGNEIEDDNDSTTSTTTNTRGGVILVQGGKQTTLYDTDYEPLFRQESYFHWLFGIGNELEGCYGTISLPSGDTTLFVQQYDIDYEIFCGPSPNLQQVKFKYDIDNVLSINELSNYIDKQLLEQQQQQQQQQINDEDGKGEDGKDDLPPPPPPPKLYLLSGLNTDSGNMAIPAYYDGINKINSSRKDVTTLLFDCIVDCRVYKTKAEIELMQYTHYVSSMAHVEVMKSCRPGMMEYQLESLFQHHTYTHGGARHMSYTCICACGPNPSILHYGHAGRPNNRQLLDGDMALLDMGVDYHCYASDITCSFPVNGQFTDDQRLIYETVLNAQIAVIQSIRPGIPWTDMHRLAERVILQGLIKGGVLLLSDDDNKYNNDIIDDMIDADLGAVFLPCGLGHFIGLDTHDVGGYAPGTPKRSDRPGLKKLRTARILQEGMVITVEPGIYFIEPLLDIALKNPNQSKYINKNRLQDFRGSGGVRLEDSVVVTKDGCENLTTCPRAVEEVLDVMNNNDAQWPPKVDMLPELRRNWVKNEKGKIIPIEINTPPAAQEN